MQIYVKSLTDKTITLVVEPSGTIEPHNAELDPSDLPLDFFQYFLRSAAPYLCW